MIFRTFLTLLFSMILGLANAQLIAIKAGKVIEPSTGSISNNQIILVENGKIKELGYNIKIPKDAEIIDLSKSTVMPGLIDAHTHICASVSKFADYLGIDFLDLVLLKPDGYRAIEGAVHAKQMLEAGFTTIREAGNAGKYVDVDVKRAINERLIPGPNIIAAGRIIVPFGGQFRTKADKKFIQNDEYFFADTQDELKKAIRENIFYGVDIIKIVVDSKRYKYSTEDIKFIVNEAQRAGLKVMAHCQTVDGLYAAVSAGVASVEHGWTIPDSIMNIMKQKKIVLVSTDFPVEVLQAYGSDEQTAKTFHDKLIKRLKRAYDSGVKLAFGSDVMIDMYNETRGQTALRYIDSFVEAGIPAIDILKIMTINSSELLGIDMERGSISKGMYCDLIATEENPLENIQTLKKVTFVMKNGVVYKKSSY
ncbi:MAG TPA: amidohydrolase family protein [Bacteroidales bacterium]